MSDKLTVDKKLVEDAVLLIDYLTHQNRCPWCNEKYGWGHKRKCHRNEVDTALREALKGEGK